MLTNILSGAAIVTNLILNPSTGAIEFVGLTKELCKPDPVYSTYYDPRDRKCHKVTVDEFIKFPTHFNPVEVDNDGGGQVDKVYEYIKEVGEWMESDMD